MEQFSVIEVAGIRVLEGPVGAPLLTRAADGGRHFALCDSVSAADAWLTDR